MPFEGAWREAPVGRGKYAARIDALDKIDKVIALVATPDRWCQGRYAKRGGRRCLETNSKKRYGRR